MFLSEYRGRVEKSAVFHYQIFVALCGFPLVLFSVSVYWDMQIWGSLKFVWRSIGLVDCFRMILCPPPPGCIQMSSRRHGPIFCVFGLLVFCWAAVLRVFSDSCTCGRSTVFGMGVPLPPDGGGGYGGGYGQGMSGIPLV